MKEQPQDTVLTVGKIRSTMLYEYFPLHFTARAKSGIHLTEFQLAKCNVLSKSMPLRDQCDICSDKDKLFLPQNYNRRCT